MACLLRALLRLYFYALFLRIILSWFPVSPGGAGATAYSFLHSVTEPVLGPLRRAIPPLAFGGMGLDLSPLIVFIVLQLLIARIPCYTPLLPLL